MDTNSKTIMKLFAIFNFASAVFGLECLTCHGRDQADCEANGKTITCQEIVEITIKPYNFYIIIVIMFFIVFLKSLKIYFQL